MERAMRFAKVLVRPDLVSYDQVSLLDAVSNDRTGLLLLFGGARAQADIPLSCPVSGRPWSQEFSAFSWKFAWHVADRQP